MSCKKFPPLVTLILAGVMALAGCNGKKQEAQKKPGAGGPGSSVPVQAITVQTGTIAQTVAVTGNIAALQDVQLAAKANGRVITVTVREGDPVRTGQLIVQQDTTDLQANVAQDQASIASAEASVLQARENYNIQVVQARQAVLQAQAQLAGAQQNYQKIKGGARPQQILQAQAAEQQAQATLENAQTNLTRYQSLYTQGAAAKADLDTAQTSFNVAQQQYNNAQAALSLTRAGNQPEDIAFAQEQVREQQTNLRTQIANLKNIQVRQAAIQAAQAGVQQARAKLAFDQQQVANAYIRSPINGIVAARETEPGQIASPGTALMRIVNVKTVYYEPTISETDFAQTTVGDPMQVQADALPGRIFQGKVAAVYPAASAGSRQFTLRVAVPNPTSELRPGMFARGTLLSKVHRNVVVIPVSALMPIQTQFQTVESSEGTATGGTTLPPQQVFLVGPGGKAVARRVALGLVTADKAEVTSGLQPGERLITVGQGELHPGDPIKVEKASTG